MTAENDQGRTFLRHALATLAYRGGKTLRDATPEFAAFRADETSRTPLEILSHLGDLLEWALSISRGQEKWSKPDERPWKEQTERFFGGLKALDDYLASSGPLGCPPAQLFQGPIADALTHVGQLAMLRRMSGSPMRGENYFVADIATGRVGAEQAPPRREFD
jgi:hypothetical protein